MAAGSMHIGSGPGVAGLSGMQVKLLVPLRRVRIFPGESMATIVACLPTLGGAADSALAINCASVGAALAADRAAGGVSAHVAANTKVMRAVPVSSGKPDLCLLMRSS